MKYFERERLCCLSTSHYIKIGEKLHGLNVKLDKHSKYLLNVKIPHQNYFNREIYVIKRIKCIIVVNNNNNLSYSLIMESFNSSRKY